MSLTTTDILKIQSAIDSYKKKYPRRPSPSAAEALAWQAGKHAEKSSNQDSKFAWLKRVRSFGRGSLYAGGR
jgi:hypothetical protein